MAVYTCTLNLAIDLFIETDEMKPFQVNRTKDDDIQANGKRGQCLIDHEKTWYR